MISLCDPFIVLNGSYDERCDMFSVGVVVYTLLSGQKPFWGPNKKMSWEERRQIMIDLIKSCDYSPLTGRGWKDISSIAKDFVTSLLQLNPGDRPTPTEALRSRWITSCYTESDDDEHGLKLSCRDEEMLDQLHSTRQGLWKLLSTKLDEDEIVGLRAYVEILDEDGQCTISLDSLYNTLLEGTSCTKEDLNGIIECDVQTKINYVDFFAEVLLGIGRNNVERLAKSLDSLDVDGTRKLKSTDVKLAIEEVLPPEISASVLNSLKFDDNDIVDTSVLLSTVTEIYAGRQRDSNRSGRHK